MKRILTLFAVVALVVAMAVPAFADEYVVPSVKDVWDSETYPYAVVGRNDSGQIWLTMCTSAFKDVEGEVVANGAYKTYMVGSNNTWVAQSTSNGDVFAGLSENLLYSTHDINVRGMVGNLSFPATPDFFNPPPPLSEVIQGVTEETLQEKTLPEVNGTMNTLLLCGVGLIALLVVLKLFGKRSLIYRG